MGRLYAIMSLLSIMIVGCKDYVQTYSKGVSLELAESRSEKIKDVRYDLSFSIPVDIEENISARLSLSFNLTNDLTPLVLDFKETKESVLAINAGSNVVDYKFENEHIIIPAKYLKKGGNTINISFIAGNTSLNRNKEFLYTLLVPDRARTLFPCFDQPDIKAVYSLKLEIPEAWTAVANGKLKKIEDKGDRKIFSFNDTEKLSTYLFSFTAGKFQQIEKNIDGSTISLFHRETDKEKIQRNIDIIFEQVVNSINWLEDYTNIDYPFSCYNIVCIPSFQYGGMEHPGNTLYRSSLLFLEESASQSQKLRRAQLIAHETAHMWFGDLVTMKWFDDVWLKEVFANFYADKMVNPMFPQVNHKLGFVMGHYPAAYKVDRSKGANPVIQDLPNLNEAGTVYGNIIYHKSPIVMDMLEDILGKDKLKRGIMEYLSKYSYSNAIWDDLVQILDKYTDINLREWSNIWVKEAGMPHITCQRKDVDSKKGFVLRQSDPMDRERLWGQTLDVCLVLSDGSVQIKTCDLKEKECFFEGIDAKCVIPNAGRGYGYFKLDDESLKWLSYNISDIKDSVIRGMALLDLYEELINKRIRPIDYLNLLGKLLKVEKEKLIINTALSQYGKVYWTLLQGDERKNCCENSEALFVSLIKNTNDKGLKYQYFNLFLSVALSDKSVSYIKRIWEKKEDISGVKLSEDDYISISYALALRQVKDHQKILDKQRKNIANPDKLAKFDFIRPVLSEEIEVRDEFFESLKDSENREHEVWVQNSLSLLHHPLRADESVKYLRRTLELLKEIQETGDIFFPIGWLSNSFGTYSSDDAAKVVVDFLNENPDYYESLRLKILQETDILLRNTGYISKLN